MLAIVCSVANCLKASGLPIHSPRMGEQHGCRVEHGLWCRRYGLNCSSGGIGMQKVASLLDALLVLRQAAR